MKKFIEQELMLKEENDYSQIIVDSEYFNASLWSFITMCVISGAIQHHGAGAEGN